MTNLATLFNISYLSRGLALIDSLNEHYLNQFQMYILCLDDDVYNKALESELGKNIIPVSLNDIEAFYPELIHAKNNRSIIEYYFTLSPVFPLFLLKKYNLDHITTLDSDMYFFSNPSKLFDKIHTYSISITPHNFSKKLEHSVKYGIYNVSFQGFKNNEEGLNCLEKWKIDCLNWCFDIREDDRFADQKYLDSWEKLYKDLYVINDFGTGVAPWNIEKFRFNYKNGKVLVNSNELIYYHFHQLRIKPFKIFELNLKYYVDKADKILIKEVYKPYIKSLLKNTQVKSVETTRDETLNRRFFINFVIEPFVYIYIFGFLFGFGKIGKIRAFGKKIIKQIYGKTN